MLQKFRQLFPPVHANEKAVKAKFLQGAMQQHFGLWEVLVAQTFNKQGALHLIP